MRKKFLILIIFFNLTFLGGIALAQGGPGGGNANSLQYEMVSYGNNNKSTNLGIIDGSFLNQKYFNINYQSFSNAFQFFFDLIMGVSIAAAVILFMYGAFEGIIGSAGVAEKKDANDRMKNAIIGLMIVLSTWLIINTINPDLLRLPLFTGLDNLNPSQYQKPAIQKVSDYIFSSNP